MILRLHDTIDLNDLTIHRQVLSSVFFLLSVGPIQPSKMKKKSMTLFVDDITFTTWDTLIYDEALHTIKVEG